MIMFYGELLATSISMPWFLSCAGQVGWRGWLVSGEVYGASDSKGGGIVVLILLDH